MPTAPHVCGDTGPRTSVWGCPRSLHPVSIACSSHQHLSPCLHAPSPFGTGSVCWGPEPRLMGPKDREVLLLSLRVFRGAELGVALGQAGMFDHHRLCLIPWISWGWAPAGGDRTGTSGGNTQRAEQTRTTQSAGNKHGAQQ